MREADRSGIVEPYVYAFPLLKSPLDKAMDVLFLRYIHWDNKSFRTGCRA